MGAAEPVGGVGERVVVGGEPFGAGAGQVVGSRSSGPLGVAQDGQPVFVVEVVVLVAAADEVGGQVGAGAGEHDVEAGAAGVVGGDGAGGGQGGALGLVRGEGVGAAQAAVPAVGVGVVR